VALSVINDVLNNDAYANIALNEKIKSEHLTELDKKLVTQLVYGTISKKSRWTGIPSLMSKRLRNG
jgi:16S rRNA (cytosine967-C5)-methyltransferase